MPHLHGAAALYVVEADRLHWLIRHNGQKFHGYASSREAVVAAIATAQRAGEWGFHSLVALRTECGDEEILWTYGLDAFPPFQSGAEGMAETGAPAEPEHRLAAE